MNGKSNCIFFHHTTIYEVNNFKDTIIFLVDNVP